MATRIATRVRALTRESSPQLCLTAGWIRMPFGTEVNLGPGDVVLDGIAVPQCSVYVYCGKMAGWMKTPLDSEVDLGQATLC